MICEKKLFCEVILGALAKLRKLSVCRSVRMEKLGWHWADFSEIRYFRIFFWKYVDKINVLLNSDKNNDYFAWRAVHIYDHI